MILAFLLVFFGIRSYRENAGGGAITFGRAFKVGLLITLITCGMYVISWEIVYWGFIPDFADKYAVHMIDRMEKKGRILRLSESMTSINWRFRRMSAIFPGRLRISRS